MENSIGKLEISKPLLISRRVLRARILRRSLRQSVSNMLGHTNVKTTQLYARITDAKVSNDMDTLQENLQGVFDKPLTQSIMSRKKVAQAKEIAQLTQQLGVAL